MLEVQLQKSAQLSIIFAAVCWGLLGVFTRPLIDAGFSVLEVAAIRNIAAGACLILFILVTNREKLKIRIKDIWIFIFMGGFGLVLNSMCYFNTIELTTLSAASILLYTSPYMVMLISALLFKDKITLQKISALLIAFTGCVMTVGVIGSHDISTIGILTGLGAAFCYSLYTIFGKIALKRYDPLTVTAYAFVLAGIILIPFFNVGKMAHLVQASSMGLWNLLGLAFLVTFIPFVAYIKGLEKLEPSRVVILAFVEPLTSSVAGILIYQEMLSFIKILGMALIFLSLVILNLKPLKKQEE